MEYSRIQVWSNNNEQISGHRIYIKYLKRCRSFFIIPYSDTKGAVPYTYHLLTGLGADKTASKWP